MDSKEDYFTSPAPKNFESFYSPFRLLRHEDDPLLLGPLTSPFNRNSNSSFSPYSPSRAEQSESNNTNKLEVREFAPKKIEAILSFDNENESLSDNMETPHSNQIKITNAETAPRKKYDLRLIESNEKQQNFKDGEKGLRALSKQAFEVLQHSEALTYQEVAERIILENEDLNDYPEVLEVEIRKEKKNKALKEESTMLEMSSFQLDFYRRRAKKY